MIRRALDRAQAAQRALNRADDLGLPPNPAHVQARADAMRVIHAHLGQEAPCKP